MTDIEIIDDAHEYVTRSSDPDERWDCDDTDCDHSIEGFRVAPKRGYSDLTVNFDAEYDTNYFLVYAIYDTGCSFCSTGGRIEFIDLFEDEQVAQENVRRINEHSVNESLLNGYQKVSAKQKKKLAKTHETYSVTLINGDGQEYQVHVPWHGYFESLASVNMDGVTRLP